MKISQEIHTKIEQTQYKKSSEGKQNFEALVQTQTHKLHQTEIQKLMQDITEQGEKLAKFRSFKDLATFKRMVRNFLQETVSEGLELSESRNFNRNSYRHKLVTVKEVDKKLVELTDDLMDQEKQTVDLLGVIGEIRGLLINLYT